MDIPISLQQRVDSPRALSELEAIWLQRFEELRAEENQAPGPPVLAAPFLSVAPPAYRPGSPGTIMLVGKATSGDNTLGEAPIHDRYNLAAVQERYRAVIEDQLTRAYTSPFLNFAERLSKKGLQYTIGKLQPFDNLIWTNLTKIGTRKGNPAGSLTGAERHLIAETLAAEIKIYRPRLVVVTTGFYRFGLVREILTALSGEDGKDQMYSASRLWAKTKTANGPAYLWTMHPQGKRAVTLEDWITEADALMSGD